MENVGYMVWMASDNKKKACNASEGFIYVGEVLSASEGGFNALEAKITLFGLPLTENSSKMYQLIKNGTQQWHLD